MRKPDLVIGDSDAPYLLRWWVIPRNPIFNVYLHKILRSDDDRALHDHPWVNLSFILAGEYVEIRPVAIVRRLLRQGLSTCWGLETEAKLRRRFSLVFRRPRDAHRLVVLGDGPVWSLFITGPRVREWGFHFARWVSFMQVVCPNEPGRLKDHV